MNDDDAKTIKVELGAVSGRAGAVVDDQHVLPVDFVIDNRYRVLSVIGEGGNGVVYKVRQILLNKDMALKTLNRKQENPTAVRRFQQEAKAASALDHPNLVKVVDFGVLENEQPFLVMELIEGVSFAARIRQRGAIPPDELLPIFISVCEGLAYAHDRGVVHRDIKPGNIMLMDEEGDSQQKVKIVDFGIAKLSDEDGEIQSLTRTGEIFGSPLYMSPEQCLGSKVDHRADIYSLGCVIYEALTGTTPFIGSTAMQTMMKHTTDRPPSLTEASLGREFPPQLEKIVFRMLEKSPDDRFNHALLIAQELRELDLARTSEQTSAVKLKQSPAVAGLRKSRWHAVAALCVLALLSGVGIGFLSISFMKKGERTKVEIPVDRGTDQFKGFIEIPKEKQAKLEFMPISVVYQRPDGTMWRRYHIPRSLGRVNGENQQLIDEEYFERPIYFPIFLEVSFEIPLTADVLSGFDPDAINCLWVQSQSLDESTMQSIGKLRGMVSLTLDNSKISKKDLLKVNDLQQLTSLSIKNIGVTPSDIFKLNRLMHLHKLLVSDIPDGSKLLEMLKHSKALKYLNCVHCELTDSDMATIAKMQALEDLSVSRNEKITDNGLKHLITCKLLRSLDLRGCSFSKNAGKILSKIPTLKKIQISPAEWSHEDLAQFKKDINSQVPRCEVKYDHEQAALVDTAAVVKQIAE